MLKNNFTTWLEISSQAIKHNLKQLEKLIDPNITIMPIIKSNAYGHGIIEVAKILVKLKVEWLGVVNLEEALELRKNNINTRILVLSFYRPDLLIQSVKNNITLTIYSYKAAVQLNKISKKLNKISPIHFKIDTGTSRLGLLPKDVVEEVIKIKKLKNLKLEGIFSHLADAENPNQEFTEKQNEKFNKLIKKLKENGINFKLQHLACSASAFLNKNTHKSIIRYGISLYGLWSIEKNIKSVKNIYKKINLKPVLSWYTKVIQIKTLKANTDVGYGRSYKTKDKTKIALIPIGYYDGYDRKLSNSGEVIIKGIKCRVIGRVCMNLTVVDVTKIRNLKTGDTVTLIGVDKKANISIDDLAKKIGTINYEVVARINKSIPRITIK